MSNEAAYHREWRRKNPEKSRAILRKWRLLNPEKVKEQKQRYYQKHKARVMEATKKWREEHREQLNAAERRAAKAPHRRKQRQVAQWKRRYGLTAEAAESLMASQNHACAICHTPFANLRKICVDHCHASTVVRGFLCNHCNVGIAQFRDNPDLLLAAVSYLRRYQTL